MARPEQLKSLLDEDALQRAQEKRQKVDQGVNEKVSITKKMYGELDACIKSIGKRNEVVQAVECVVCGHAAGECCLWRAEWVLSLCRSALYRYGNDMTDAEVARLPRCCPPKF